MRQLSPSGQQAIDEISQRHGFSANAVLSMLESVINGNGSITLSISPTGNYTYLWNTGATTPNLSNLPPGDYSVTVSGGGASLSSSSRSVPCFFAIS